MGQAFKYDIETWMPSRDSYGETHSASRFCEFQARDAAISGHTAPSSPHERSLADRLRTTIMYARISDMRSWA